MNFPTQNEKIIFTIASPLIWFQYQIIHKILGTRSLFFKMSKTETNLCRNCGLSEETIEHLFFHCVKVKEFLFNLDRSIESLTGITCQFTFQEVLLGIIQVGIAIILRPSIYCSFYTFKITRKEWFLTLQLFPINYTKYI